MREHTRNNGRYMRTEVGALTLDWGSNGADYNALDFSYVAKGKMGNLHKIYGQVRRSEDKETYETYDIKAGRRRLITKGTWSVNAAIRAHVSSITGRMCGDIDVDSVMPIVPNTIRKEITEVIITAIKKLDDFWTGEAKNWSEGEKQKAREAFARETWNCGKFFCQSLSSRGAVVPVGVLNVEVCAFSNLYRLWKEACEAIEKV